jgi:intron-binding protein aquarius
MLVTGELWPSKRVLAEEEDVKAIPGEAIMEGVEHLGQYVYEMTNAKVQQLRAERGIPDDAELPVIEEGEEDSMAYWDEGEQPMADGLEAEVE